MRKISITTHTTEIVAKWMILTELKLKKENERDACVLFIFDLLTRAADQNEREIKNPKQTQSLNNDRAQGRRASKNSGGNQKA